MPAQGRRWALRRTVGAWAYSIIEQGRVGFVISARPEERKLLIDEVAGVNHFKGQRTEAERRMKETREPGEVADLEENGAARGARRGRKAESSLSTHPLEAGSHRRGAAGPTPREAAGAQERHDGVAERQASEAASTRT